MSFNKPIEEYDFFIKNKVLDIGSFKLSSNTKTVVGRGIQWFPQSINPKATTTITVQGNVSGITKVATVQVRPNPDSSVSPVDSTVDVTDPKF